MSVTRQNISSDFFYYLGVVFLENKTTSCKKEFSINGTSVWFDFNDQLFIGNLFKLVAILDEKPEFSEGNDIKTISNNLEKMENYLTEFKNRFDKLFGENSCEKVFSCKLPTIDVATEFILLAIPVIEECFETKEEYQKKLIEKYGNRQQRRIVAKR